MITLAGCAVLQVLASTSLSWSPPPGWLVAGPLARTVLVPLLLTAATRCWLQQPRSVGVLANYSSYSWIDLDLIKPIFLGLLMSTLPTPSSQLPTYFHRGSVRIKSIYLK